MFDSKLIKEAQEYAVMVLTKLLPEDMTYHSINHTKDVVKSTQEIAEKNLLSSEEFEIVMIAAWFHDLGYVKGCEDHEKNSTLMARGFLEERDFPKGKIAQVEGCIMATKMPQSPQNKLEQILCDADLMHLAEGNYFEKADLLLKEIEKTRLCKISENEWLEMNQEFLDKHCFFTEYAQKNYESAVKENLKKVRERLRLWKKAKK